MVAVQEGIGAQDLQFGVQRDSRQFITPGKGTTATAVRTTRSHDILAEHDTHDLTTVADITTDVFHQMALAVSGHCICNHNMSRFRHITTVGLDALEGCRPVIAFIRINQFIAVLVGYCHVVSHGPKRQGHA